MQIEISGNTLCLEMSVEFETDGTTKRGLLRKRSTEWSLLHIDSNNSEWVGSRRISLGEAIKRALVFLEREASKEALAAHEAARAVADLRRNQ